MNKRDFFRLLVCSVGILRVPSAFAAVEDRLREKVNALEQALGARLGVAIIDASSGEQWDFNGGKRFPMCSTFKLLAVAAVLVKVDKGLETLDREIVIEQSDLVSYSPITEKHVGAAAMSLAQICAAALMYSDNTAGNKLLESIGGPSELTRFARSIGDDVTRLDRWETELNEAAIGDERDTSSPLAMVTNLRHLMLGDTLSESAKKQLNEWMIANTTGDAKLRAGLPSDWAVGDKTGGGQNGTMADVAVLWPPTNVPIFVAVYMTETNASFDARNAAIAEIARAISASRFA